MVKKDFSEKNPFGPFLGKKGKSGRGRWADWARYVRFPTYLEFGSSDFDETFRKCSWYEKNEDRQVWSHDDPFLPGLVHHLGPNWSQKVLFQMYLEFGSSDFDETLRECSWYEKNDD